MFLASKNLALHKDELADICSLSLMPSFQQRGLGPGGSQGLPGQGWDRAILRAARAVDTR
jgi:hypothetical protein